MSFLSLSPAAFAPFRLFVRHGKYVRFGVPGALGVKGWQEGQLAPCLGHGPNSCAGTPVMVASLFCSPPSPRGDATVLGGGAGGDRSHAGGGHGCYVPFAGRWCPDYQEHAAAFWLGPRCSVAFREFSAECQEGLF